MESWNDIINDEDFCPQYIELTLTHLNGQTEVVNALLLEGVRLDFSSVSKGWHPYHIRHSDYDMSKPSTVEKSVIVNFFGTILVDHDLGIAPQTENTYATVEHCHYWDSWEDMAKAELQGHGIDDQCALDLWGNLYPIKNNIENFLTSFHN